eukprot:jgi/Astpho2/9208/e_gw1.00137.63.1_t
MNYVAEQEASRTMEVAYQISQLLDTGLDKQTIGILVALCQNGVNPEASPVVRELRREAAAQQGVRETQASSS